MMTTLAFIAGFYLGMLLMALLRTAAKEDNSALTECARTDDDI